MPAINKILIANRGEIALRIIRACRDMGIRSVAVYSTADKDSLHAKLADESVCIGPAPAKESYLNESAILTAALLTNADAIHPGYGFLSERSGFIEKVEQHKLIWIGPGAKIVAEMGDKVVAKHTAAKCGLPLIPGSDGAVDTLTDAHSWAEKIGYPVMLKAAAGGGGKGMRKVYSAEEMPAAFQMTKAEALNGFGDDTLYMEKLLVHPRHIEFQVLGDTHGNVVIFGERDCTLQRKHQKVMEECPATCLTKKQRDDMIKTCAVAAKKMGYTNAGTLEFMFEDGKFYFLEMNTRLQVEHPVTEMVYRVDLVREQIRIAMGEKLGYDQSDLKSDGHAIEFRINAEDPETFIPNAGQITAYSPPGGLGIRIDSAAYDGWRIPPTYDSMIAKLIVWAPDRSTCMLRSERALDEFSIEGVKTTIPLHKRLLESEDVKNLTIDNQWMERVLIPKKEEPK
ncbi:MAG: acetyl-CoA carboxylase biotin carboxylase subunit [Alphaproteobacteria bacterium]|nr:acetyl-CoA carboxylase biotin carboxylase subunit [Alphaproteobacteria bacterium]MCL2757833.1 acetyl-CoA carboxylase biotin carboxylase subunit [Alphaproteobacteria bacterium]